MKDTLLTGEFAINNGATLKVVNSTIKFSPNSKSTVTITLVCDLNDPADLQTKTGKINSNFVKCGIFKKTSKKTSEVCKPFSVLVTNDAVPQIQIRSEQNDATIITDGVKGNHGN